MTYNYHTHTKRCGHATGEMENYVLRAIENGIKYMGFSEHISFQSPDGADAYFRLPKSQIQEYLDEVNILKEKYKDKISISLGFEMEYYPDSFEAMLKTAKDCNAEYLLLGQHFFQEEYLNPLPTARKTEDEEALIKYVNLVTDAMKTGAFLYVAHPDIINFEGDEQIYTREMTKICEASKELNIPLELNFLGIRCERRYPYEKFWEIAGEIKCPVTFGFDAHDEASAYDGESLIKAKEIVKKYNLNYIGNPFKKGE